MKLEASESSNRSSSREVLATIEELPTNGYRSVGVLSCAGNDGEWNEAMAFFGNAHLTREQWIAVRDAIDAAWVEFERKWGLPLTYKERERRRDEMCRAEFARRCIGPADERYFFVDPGISGVGPFWAGPVCSMDPLCGRIERGEIPKIQGRMGGGSLPPAWMDGRFFILGPKDWVEIEADDVVVSRAHGIERLPRATREHVVETLRSLGLL